MKHSYFRVSHLALATLLISGTTHAGGFQLFEQSAAGVGNFRSGGAAAAKDASTAFYNAAGLTHIDHTQLTLSGVNILTRAKFKGNTSQQVYGFFNGPSANNATASIHGENIVPAMQIATPITKDLFFGFDVSVPFGLSTSWDNDSVVRYAATESSIEVMNVSGSLGYRITDAISVGGGLDAQHLKGTFNQEATIGNQPQFDTPAKNEVSGVGHGWHLGLLYDFSHQTRVGISYRSEVEHEAAGRSTFVGPISLDSATKHSRAKVSVTLPSMTTVSLFHQFNDQWDMMATVYHTHWSVIEKLQLTGVASDQNKPITVTNPTEYRDAYSAAIGFAYRPTGRWSLTFGGGYDQTPTTSRHRDIRLPDNDRYALSIGAGFQATKNLRVDAGWAHLFIKDVTVDNTAVSGNQSAHIEGDVKGSADLLGLQFTWDIT